MDGFLYLRRIVSGYEDLIKMGVRLQNQRYALLRIAGKNGYEKNDIELNFQSEQFVLESLDKQITAYEEEKQNYDRAFKQLARKHPEIKNQKSLPGGASDVSD